VKLENIRNIAWKNLAIILVAILVFFGFEEHQARKYAPQIETVLESVKEEMETKPTSADIVIDVYDGDTFTLSSGLKVRLIGINAPEIGQEYATTSRDYLASLVIGKKVRLEKDRTDLDKYDRLLRYVYVEDVFVNEELVKAGLAVAKDYYPDTAKSSLLEKAQSEAKNASLGIWK
jgi:micrococcal nuclease